jgi:hypothetical protein
MLVVQDNGIEKSLRTYADEQVRLVAGSTELDGTRGVGAYLTILTHPERFMDRPFFKLRRPELRRVIGKKRISAREFMSAGDAVRAQGVLRQSRAAMKEWGIVGERVAALLEAAERLTIVPRVDFRGRRGEWVSPWSAQEDMRGAADDLLATWDTGDADSFDLAAGQLVAAQRTSDGFGHVSLRKIWWDRAASRARPFLWSARLYLLSAVFFAVALWRDRRWPRTAATRSRSRSGSVPNSSPSWTFGHETFSSTPAMQSTSSSRRQTVT